MSWLPGRVPDEVRARARRRLDALARPRTPSEVNVTVEGDPPRPSLRADLTARLPATVRDGRLAVSRTAAWGLAILAAAGLVLAGSYAWRGRSVEAVLPAAPAQSASRSAGPPPTSASPSALAAPVGEVVVDVAGKVRHPGVVHLPLGARVVDAIAAAGGIRGKVDLTALNLARVLTDGEQVLVGVGAGSPAGGAGGAPDGGPTASAGAAIDLNAATLEQLDSLPGVGPVLAQRILDWRTAHGRFSTIDELREVSGIGEARFADLAARVRV